eukprot:CAMPEP_0172482328 /NCGR_PEP_ID=MMETSP1066-20121228/8650_1 /TAXON_ID=671091 /ORGANISM="Coscinodiscus wailesii, Strain CCMP2513" /LENGTH=148 /DNA_ID=CAMNT_0013245349 /DNA_START=162 /DNA_END=608 /DNA_ORIENTATION=-
MKLLSIFAAILLSSAYAGNLRSDFEDVSVKGTLAKEDTRLISHCSSAYCNGDHKYCAYWSCGQCGENGRCNEIGTSSSSADAEDVEDVIHETAPAKEQGEERPHPNMECTRKPCFSSNEACSTHGCGVCGIEGWCTASPTADNSLWSD